MADLQIRFEAQDQARQQILQLRRNIARVNAEVLENNMLQRVGNRETRQALQTRNQELRLRRQTASLEREALNIRLAGIREEERATRRLERAHESFVANISLIAGQTFRHLQELTGNIIDAASQMQTFSATLVVAEGDANAAEQAFARLQDVTLDLVGIETQDLISFYSQFRGAGLSADAAISSISGLTKAVAEQGKPAATTSRLLVQLGQAYNANRIQAQDLRSIIAELPGFYRRASEALGETIRSTDEFRDVAQATVGETAALVQVFSHLDQTSRGADLSTFNAQLDIFNDQLFILRAEIGATLLPAFTNVLMFGNSMIQVFRGLHPVLQTGVSFLTLTATALTGLTVVGGTAIIAINALNASLLNMTGATGLAGVAALLAPAAPVLTGLGLFAAAFLPLGLAIRNHVADIREARAAELAYAESVRATLTAIQSNTGISERIDEFRRLTDELVAQRDELNRNLGGGAARALDIQGLEDLSVLDNRISRYDMLTDVLTNVRRGAELTIDELRVLDQNIATSLFEARSSGQDGLVGELEGAAESVRGIFMEFEQGRQTTQNVFMPLTESVTSLTARLIDLDDQLIRAQNTARDASGIDEVVSSYNNLLSVTREIGESQLRQTQLQLEAEGALLRNAELSGQEREDVQNSIIDLSLKYRETQLRVAREITQVETEEANKRRAVQEQLIADWLQVVDGAQDAEAPWIAAAESLDLVREAMENINSLSRQTRFGGIYASLVEQGYEAAEAVRLAELSVRDTQGTLERAAQTATTFGTSFAGAGSHIENTFIPATRAAAEGLTYLVNQANLASQAQEAAIAAIEERVIFGTGRQVGGGTFDETAGLPDIPALRRSQLQEEYRDIERSLNQQYQQYQQTYNRIGNTITGILTGRFDSVADAAQRLLSDLLGFVIRQEIAQRLSDAREVAINTAKANAKIVNEKRVQAEVIRTATLSRAAESGTAAGLGLFGPLGLILGALSLGSLALNSIGSRNVSSSSSNFISSRNVSRDEERPLNINIEFDDGTTRAVQHRVESNDRSNRN